MNGGDGSLTGDVAGRALGAYGRRFPRAARLLRSREFREAYDGGEGVHGRWMVLFRREGKGMDFRLGVVASKRVGGAPERARAKRRLREAFRRNRWRLERGQADVVAVARKGAVDAPWGELEAEWLMLLRKLGYRFCGAGEAHTEARRDGGTEGEKLTRRRGDAEAKEGEEG